jgi:C-terminal processing protease CtpA/Prc
MSKRLLVAVACMTGLTAVPAVVSLADAQTSCSVQTQNRFVRDALTEYYYWNRELPALNPANFASPQAYLDAARYKPLDLTYSYIANRADQDALYSASQFIGIGMSTPFDGVEMRVSEVYPDSPASEAGFKRGDRILKVNGRTVAEIAEANELTTAFGPHEDGQTVTIEWRPLAEAPRPGQAPPPVPDRKATLAKRVVTIPTVPVTRLFEVDGRKVGYVAFRSFVEPSVEALDQAFITLRDAGASELVLDMRYNGGGLVSVAQHLASLIGGPRLAGQVLTEYVHNDRHRELNTKIRFDADANALNLTRLVVITTRATASSSELIINGLKPYMPVVLVGDRTYGKPVGQYGLPFCDKVLNPVSLVFKNALGEFDYFTGLAPTCPAGDGLDRALGDPEEASLKEAFVYLRTGACTPPLPTDPTTPAGLRRVGSTVPPADGWQLLLGAH